MSNCLTWGTEGSLVSDQYRWRSSGEDQGSARNDDDCEVMRARVCINVQ